MRRRSGAIIAEDEIDFIKQAKIQLEEAEREHRENKMRAEMAKRREQHQLLMKEEERSQERKREAAREEAEYEKGVKEEFLTVASVLTNHHQGNHCEDQMDTDCMETDSRSCVEKLAMKILIIGESSVGKSSLVHQYLHGNFNSNMQSTTGVNFASKEELMESTQCKFSIWDLSGDEKHHDMRKSYYRGVAGVLLVYDVTSSLTFERISSWVCELRMSYPEGKIPTILLCGNKTDLIAERVISTEMGQQMALKEGVGYIETSATSSSSVSECISRLYSGIKVQYLQSLRQKTENSSTSTVNSL
eukprot:CAMPEP_0114983110 /NCGR_PEP_ID=MMETSP0216-20121206/6513_1 /TAXON_ID=223996 /ORGANISM="Protocruzia adherens, Strain Boccale" /LENGTH=302 /DNA_ID=CAMNT_0002345047 /DNA_START=185 /DNA_END=1093 /DNA_ORIENTATION=+